MSIDFDKMNVPDLESLIERAREEVSRRKVSARDRLKQEIEDKLKETGLDLADLFPGSGRRTKKSGKETESRPAPIKYRDPVSLGTWSGRGGRPPQWVKSIMMERRWTLEEFKASGEYNV
jgi:DNA-binding protein H-NS